MKKSVIAKNITTGKTLIFESAKEASKLHGFDPSHIIKCCRGRRKNHKGHTWSYNSSLGYGDKKWSLEEDIILASRFSTCNLDSLLNQLPSKNFKDILFRAKSLQLDRHHVSADKISPYDLIYEIAEDVLFEDNY